MSSVSRASSPKNMADDYDESAEESGWTTYFEDFFNNQNNNNNNIDGDNNNNKNNNNSHQNGSMNYLSGVDSSSSLVSDAASLAARKVDGDNTNNLQGEEELSKKSNRSSFSKSRRKKIKTAFVDDALEDTASSPLNSPKVLYENQLHKTNQKEEQRDPFQEKGNRSGGQGDDERKEEFGFDGRDSDCTQLKKRGLCLVPLSMVLKYI